ncbi:hypothetical protein G7067_12625 [Leucobacter insecticola]|uniref:Surface-anchored protein n=1 Tax=Leucobacter insecticola TaxID=2714934 RepID=A0A6G8FL42_9MICO|nr:choice-of-anchor M domain-containing protein [Leucobacter insecticola]QIM17058.1 hypothetical protein G7067_12625 [Leucobacter insecticola]
MLTKTRARGGALIGVLALMGGLGIPTAASAVEAPLVIEDPVRLESGHIDAFNLILNEDDTPRLVLKEDVTGTHVLRTPESVELAVKSQSFSTGFPAAAVPPGAPTSFYHLPLTQDWNLIWPGWDTQGVQSAFPGADTKISVAVDGPGQVYLWTQGLWGAPASLLVDGGYSLPGTIDQPFPAHTHANWAFTEPGTYKLSAQATVKSGDGAKTAVTNSASYTFVVSPIPTAVTVTGADAVVAAGDNVTLSAAQIPAESSFNEYAWSTRNSDTDAWQAVAGANSATLTVAAAEGAQYRVAVSGGQDFASGSAKPLVVESEPVKIQVAAPSVQTIAIGKLAHHYHSNSPINLSVTGDPAVENGTYRWFLQRSDQAAPVQIEGATGASHRLTAEQALDGAQVTAELIGEGATVLATASAVKISVNDHGAAPLQKVSVSGIADHYHSGDTVQLSASVTPASVLNRYEWYVQKQGEAAPILVDGANDASYSFAASEELNGAAVIAKLSYDDGRPYVESAPVVVKLDDHHGGEVPETDLTIKTNRAADDYWVGQGATLTAEQSTPTGLSEYQWWVKLPGADSFAAVDGQTAATYKFKPSLANSGIQVKVQLLHNGKVHAESKPVTITAKQREIATVLNVTTDKHSYVPGDVAKLTSTQTPQTDHDHYHWYIKRAGATDFVWVDQSRDKDLAYPVTAEDAGAQLVLRLFDETHAVLAESAPVTLSVTTSGENPVPETTLTVEGLAAGYYAGDTAKLTAVQNPVTGEDHYHWFIKRAGDADYSVISGARGAELKHEVKTGDAGALIVAKLYGHGHKVIAESQPVALTVLPGSAKPSKAPQAQSESALDHTQAGGISLSTKAPVQGQVVSVQLGKGNERAGEWIAAWMFSEPKLLGNDWVQVAADGSIAVTIPADLPVGAHRLAVFDAAGQVIGWEQLQVSAAGTGGGTTPGAKPGDVKPGAVKPGGTAGDKAGAAGSGLAKTGSELPIGIGFASGLLLLAGTGTVLLQRRRNTTPID